LRGQQRYGGRAPRRDRGAFQDQAALARGHVEDHHIPLDGGARRAGVAGREADQLGHGHLAVGGGHAKQAATGRQGHHDARRHLRCLGLQQQGGDLFGQFVPGQQPGRGLGVKGGGGGHAGMAHGRDCTQ